MKKNNNVAMIEVVAKGLGPLKKNVVFVGGATVSFYLENPEIFQIRPTDDIDCVIEIASRQDYYTVQTTLEKLGFKHSQEDQAPICRMDFSGLKVDIMPSDPRILGFSNKWYQEGITHAIETTLPNSERIKIFSLPYFIAAKIEAFLGRGLGDFRLSSDMEDIVTVLAGQKNLQILSDSAADVKTYIKNHFRTYIGNLIFIEALSAHLDPGPKRHILVEMILKHLNRFLVTG